MSLVVGKGQTLSCLAAGACLVAECLRRTAFDFAACAGVVVAVAHSMLNSSTHCWSYSSSSDSETVQKALHCLTDPPDSKSLCYYLRNLALVAYWWNLQRSLWADSLLREREATAVAKGEKTIVLMENHLIEVHFPLLAVGCYHRLMLGASMPKVRC